MQLSSMGDKGNSGLTWWQISAAIDTHILFASNGRRSLVLRVNSVKQVEPRNNHERRLRKNIMICLWPLDQSAEGKGWRFTDMWDTDKLKYFVIIEFNNCFISQSLNLFFTEQLPEVKRSAIFTQEWAQEGEKNGFLYAWAQCYLQPNTVGWHCAWADHYL